MDPTLFSSDDLAHLVLEIFLELDLPAQLTIEVGGALIPVISHHEYDFPWGVGAFPSEIMKTAPMP